MSFTCSIHGPYEPLNTGTTAALCPSCAAPGPISLAPKDEPVPAWAAVAMSDQARWTGLWAGVADGLARLLRSTTATVEEVDHALAAYDRLHEVFMNPLVIVPQTDATFAELSSAPASDPMVRNQTREENA